MRSKNGKTSTRFKVCFPRPKLPPQTARERVLNSRPNSLAEPGAVSFFQPQPDLRHHSVHFGVRQGALRASESQGKCDALVPVGNLRSAVLIEGPGLLERGRACGPSQLVDAGQESARGDRFLDHDGEVALDGRVARQRLSARNAR